MDEATPRLIGLAEVTRLTSLRKTSIYERIDTGEFRPCKLGRKTVFSESEIVAWVKARLASRAPVGAGT
jgi:predicted DNA-binding transcriptional regulator AlpA